MRAMTIGTLARQTGVKVPTIRYYEAIGLLPEPERTASNRRLYGQRERDRLAFIRHARDLGFEIDAIRTLLQLAAHPDQPCAAADSIARRHLTDIEARIARLVALRDEIARMVEHHHHGTVGVCRVIEVLADHALCQHEHRPGEALDRPTPTAA